ncbi:bifunctional DNA-formamidopyrimidine glycosylase/DNA-(apurinic or apyrimidinic site) lyase, partial [Pseudomonas cyclaminis]
MPELPEVETTRRGIAPHLEGQRVSRVVVRERRLRWPIPEDLDVRLSGQRIVLVERRAKYLLINAEVGTLISHLGMSGNLRLVEVGMPAAKHEHVDIELESGMALRYTDPRRFGAMLWSQDPHNHELLIRLGPEPLTDLFDGERLFQLSRKRSMAVKPFIMDNAVVVGVGNIYATEALFAAGIDPRREAGGISRARYLKLAIEIKRVLAAAIERGAPRCATLSVATGSRGISSRSCSSMAGEARRARCAGLNCAMWCWGSGRVCFARGVRADRCVVADTAIGKPPPTF